MAMTSAERSRKWRKNNPGADAEKSKRWRKNNPEKAKEVNDTQYQKHKNKRLHKKHQRRAKKLNVKGSHTLEQWEARCEYYGHKCVDCGSSEITKDHRIPLSKGGTDFASNLIPRCKPCNSRKGNRWIG